MTPNAGFPIPSRRAVYALGGLALATGIALAFGLPLRTAAQAAGGLLLAGLAYAGWDWASSRRAWRETPLRAEREVPGSAVQGTPIVVTLALINESRRAWPVQVFDDVDEHFAYEGLPQTVRVPARSRVEIRYRATPRLRGPARFGAVHLRWRSPGGCFEFSRRVGQAQTTRIYPDTGPIGRQAWMAGTRRITRAGTRSHALRGTGTEFRQLADYRMGDSLRHIDWKATMRHRRPIVREYQDDRGQCVFFLLDCGRRMRADEGADAGSSHFDQVLGALLQLSRIALKEGDEVGAMTFGCLPEERRHIAPRKGAAGFSALMEGLYDVQPSAIHSDYIQASRLLMASHHRRALVIVLTNFRDEDTSELGPALGLLHRQHLVMVASLRERVLGQLAGQGLEAPGGPVDVASAHLFAQARRDAFERLAGTEMLAVDAEPGQLAAALVDRYLTVKRAGAL
ncbi:Uncharacterized conserved protein (some members contain a von Willebrand factor type A (vWA) domain) [Bordetella ansorpii]|uniref:Uncharacterized conserved protein (Some members contain a von Willebrand factor type A (VWA) domain) n=1 Tax=Bordetella ansorpii TaxID=288768 RepID=A0A157RH64_9BORD|nr:DUF58 domain-containing protein [Bordetella ansorpii]SAI57342.1 Uncharacterized conserved protein (some members contain a von Willebrand factor type A (vWA) domain) [Bordetella ansorpii]